MQSSSLSKYRMEGLLGNGVFGFVFSGTELPSQRKIAWKRMLKAGKRMSRELEVLTLVRSKPHVIPLLDCFYSINYRNELVQNFIFPLCDCNLEETLRQHCDGSRPLTYREIKRLVFQVLKGLEAIHALGVCHRDLKPENVMLKDGKALVADFGSAKVLGQFNTPYVVSRYYRAPELILGIPGYNLSIDLFSLGVIFYEFLMKRLPFKGRSEGQQLIEIFKALGPPGKAEQLLLKKSIRNYEPWLERLWTIKGGEGAIWEGFGRLPIPNAERQAAIEFIRECWSFDFVKRMNATEAVKLSFFDDVRREDDGAKNNSC